MAAICIQQVACPVFMNKTWPNDDFRVASIAFITSHNRNSYISHFSRVLSPVSGLMCPSFPVSMCLPDYVSLPSSVRDRGTAALVRERGTEKKRNRGKSFGLLAFRAWECVCPSMLMRQSLIVCLSFAGLLSLSLDVSPPLSQLFFHHPPFAVFICYALCIFLSLSIEIRMHNILVAYLLLANIEFF